MLMPSDHYGAWKFNADEIAERFDRVKYGISQVEKMKIRYDAIVVHGTSGTWLGALLVMAGYKVVMLRKDRERTHGLIIEGTLSEKQLDRFIFVDDMIVSGNTVKNVREALLLHAKEYDSIQPPRIVAVVLHAQGGDDTIRNIPVFGYNPPEVQQALPDESPIYVNEEYVS